MHTIYIQKIHTKHDKTEHKWKYTCIYIYIKPLRLDTKIEKHTQSNSWVCLIIPWDQVFKGLNMITLEKG